MKAQDRRNQEIVEITNNADGSLTVTSADGKEKRLSQSTVKRWYKKVEEVIETVDVPEEPKTVETIVEQEKPEGPTDFIVFISDEKVEKKRQGSPSWLTKFALPDGSVLVLRDTQYKQFSREPISAYIQVGDIKAHRSYSSRATLIDAYGEEKGIALNRELKILRRSLQLKGE